jgi:hypothetical protein
MCCKPLYVELAIIIVPTAMSFLSINVFRYVGLLTIANSLR